METLTLFVLRGEFGCNRIINRFIEQDLKFESFGNLGLKYTLIEMYEARWNLWNRRRGMINNHQRVLERKAEREHFKSTEKDDGLEMEKLEGIVQEIEVSENF